MWPAPPKQVEREKRDTPAIAILGIERPLGFELIDHLKPKQCKKNRGSYEPPRENVRAGRFAETRASEEGFHLCARVAAWKQVASLQDAHVPMSERKLEIRLSKCETNPNPARRALATTAGVG